MQRGFEKPPFQLPEFIIRTGITEIRDALHKDEESQTARQRNRAKVAPKLGAIDVDYRTLHDAFFKYQTKPENITGFGETYYEGKELEVNMTIQPGGVLSEKLREALGMSSENSPPPWLVNMQRYGPPPSYPTLKIPGLNAPLPRVECQYGYHPEGWGKPPVDAYGRPKYGGNPFDPPGTSPNADLANASLVTSDGKPIKKDRWGALPKGALDEASGSDGSSRDEMDESSDEEDETTTAKAPASGEDEVVSVLPPPYAAAAPGELRKQDGVDTPLDDRVPKHLYQIIEQKQPKSTDGALFASEVSYSVPPAQVPEGAESVLAKASTNGSEKRKRNDDDEDGMDKNFKF